MTLGRVRQTGRGSLLARISPAGWPYEFVSARSMEKTTADGRQRIRGLLLDSVKLDMRADIARAKVETDGFQVRLQDHSTKSRKIAAALGRKATRTTELRTSLTRDATGAADVYDTSLWPSSGVVHIGTEAIGYAGKTGGGTPSFDTLTRGLWDTETDTAEGQAHYRADGAGLAYPKVTDWPQALEGRRVRLYLYGPGDDPQGDGTLVWTGIASTDVEEDGQGVWSFMLDPLTKILDQDIGGDLEDPVPIRGATYTWAAPLEITFENWSGGVAKVRLLGHHSDPDQFISKLNVAIAAAIAAAPGWTWGPDSSITAAVRDATGWDLFYQVASSGTAAHITLEIRSLIDQSAAAGYFWYQPSTTGGDDVPVASEAHDDFLVHHVNALWPRGTAGADVGRIGPGTGPDIDPGGIASIFTVYLGGFLIPSTGMTAIFMDESDSASESHPISVGVVDAAERTIDVTMGLRILGPQTRIRLGRELARGSIADLRDRLVEDSPDYCNSLGGPLIVAGDIADPDEVRAVAAATRYGSDRIFVAFQGTRLSDIVEHELRALSCYQRISSSGAIEWKRLGVTLATDEATWVVEASDVLGPVAFSRSERGVLNQVLYKTGWNPKDDKFTGPEIRPTDISASSPNRMAQVLEIARRSVPAVDYVTGTVSPVDPQEVAEGVQGLLGFYGATYDTLTFALGAKFSAVLLGDSMTVTHPRIPSSDGTRGIESVLGLVTRASFEPAAGRVVVGVQLHGQRFRGYAPSFFVSSQANVAGDQWDLTLDLAQTTGQADVARWLAAGDLLRILQLDDDTSPTEIACEVDSLEDVDVVRVTFASPWTPGTDAWLLRARASTAYDAGGRLGDYAFQADLARVIDHATVDVSAGVFAP